ncbi:hypothetical protein Leryth_025822 [Lithospermum erythrorhizon]|uniref:Uncharacterized protein n=1 Tax=Lithospermum erythrorhizon TaxID=34254 RepID=A0AAV3R4I7_LITER|nr:hypothetical protein Leryth_025822 [Lithospermum erythrorhizon]
MVSNLSVPNFTWKIQGHSFNTTVRLLSLGACQMVVGMDWLKDHNSVQFDFDQMQLTLKHYDQVITLQAALNSGELHQISGKKLSKLIKKKSHDYVGHLYSIQHSSSTSLSSLPTYPSALTHILTSFSDIFTEPAVLPPPRSIDHSIILKPNAQAMKFASYRHSHAQKQEIEKIISELLSAGFIQHCKSSFASLVIRMKLGDSVLIIGTLMS